MWVDHRGAVVVSHLYGLVMVIAHVLQKPDIYFVLFGCRGRIAEVVADAGAKNQHALAGMRMGVRRSLEGYAAPFSLEDFLIVERRRHIADRTDRNEMQAEAMVKVRVGDHVAQVAADGNGPVSALDSGVRKALTEVFPGIAAVHLTDYKVRIINSTAGADAAVRVLVESSDGIHRWRTVGASTDVIEASWLALQDAYEYWVMRWGVRA